jgi:hypothetical protein
MAFALSVEAAKLFGEAGKVMMTSTFIVILITVLINGGSTAYLLHWCGLVQGAELQQGNTAGEQQQQQRKHGEAAGQQELLLQQQVLQQQDGGCECEQVQLLLHEKLQDKLQQQGRMPGQAANQILDLRLAASSASNEASQQQPYKQQQQQQQQNCSTGKPVLVVNVYAEEVSQAGANHAGAGLQYGVDAAAAHAAWVASSAVLLEDDDALAGSASTAAVARCHSLRRRSSSISRHAPSTTTGANRHVLDACSMVAI